MKRTLVFFYFIFQSRRTMWGVFWFYILLRIYLSLRIITESGGEGFDKEERSQRGMALLNQTYKSVCTENYPGCLMACIRDSQCMSFNYWRHNSQCDLNNRTRHSAASKFFIKDISSTYMGFMREQGISWKTKLKSTNRN